MATVLTVKQCAEESGISATNIYQLIRTDQIPHIKIGNKFYINKDGFDSFLNGTSKGESMEEVNYSSMSDDELRKEAVKLADERIAYFDRKIPETAKNPWLPKNYIDRMFSYLEELHSPGYREKFANDIYHTMVDMLRRGDLS